MDVGARDVARLDIPPDARRERRFEIFCRCAVANREAHADAAHGLRVLVNGALEWSRRVATPPGHSDTLELRLQKTVPVGEALRLTAIAETHRSQRLSLRITADEE